MNKNRKGPSSNQLLRPEGVEKRPPSNIGLLRTSSISFSTQSNPLVQDFFDLIYSRMTGRVYQRPHFPSVTPMQYRTSQGKQSVLLGGETKAYS